jgi:hypothetical protein
VFADVESFRDFLQPPVQRGPRSRDITTSQFAGMSITDHSDLVSEHFQQYPVLHIDLKVNWLLSNSKGAYLMVQGCPWDHIRRHAD